MLGRIACSPPALIVAGRLTPAIPAPALMAPVVAASRPSVGVTHVSDEAVWAGFAAVLAAASAVAGAVDLFGVLAIGFFVSPGVLVIS